MHLTNIYIYFLKNKYTSIYYRIIQKAQSQHRKKSDKTYYESHHIIPKSMGGNNSSDNLVLLTAREHFIVHALLYRMTTGKGKYSMGYAWRMMRTKNINHKNRYFNSRLYESSRVNLKHTEEAKKKMSKSRTGVKRGPMSGDEKKKRSIAMSNIERGEEWKNKISKAKKGSTLSDEHRKNISEGNKGKKRKHVKCPHCKKIGGINGMKRYHFENCNWK